MADQTLTITYNTTTGLCTHSGLTSAMPNVMRRILTQLGIGVPVDANTGSIIEPGNFGTNRRAQIIASFNSVFDQDPNPYHATDNVTLTLTSV